MYRMYREIQNFLPKPFSESSRMTPDKTLHFGENLMNIRSKLKKLSMFKVSFMCILFLRYLLWNGIIFCNTS